MLDGVMRRLVAPPLRILAGLAVARGVGADAVTLAGVGFGVACGASIAFGAFWTALAFLAASRIADGLDGAIAQRSGATDFGGYLDIVCDFVFYASVPLGFSLFAPDANAIPAVILLASFYVNGASFLAFSALAAKRGLATQVRGPKSLYFTTGLMEGSETIAFFVAFLLWPAWFSPLALVFAGLCLITAGARVMLARRVFAVDDAGSPHR